jgi:hypothetical protein
MQSAVRREYRRFRTGRARARALEARKRATRFILPPLSSSSFNQYKLPCHQAFDNHIPCSSSFIIYSPSTLARATMSTSPTTTPTSTTATATTATTSSSLLKRHTLTNTNTDLQCCDKNASFLQKNLYRFNLWTGLYMLNPYERTTFHVLGWISMIAFLLYGAVFLNGFMDGIQRG